MTMPVYHLFRNMLMTRAIPLVPFPTDLDLGGAIALVRAPPLPRFPVSPPCRANCLFFPVTNVNAASPPSEDVVERAGASGTLVLSKKPRCCRGAMEFAADPTVRRTLRSCSRRISATMSGGSSDKTLSSTSCGSMPVSTATGPSTNDDAPWADEDAAELDRNASSRGLPRKSPLSARGPRGPCPGLTPAVPEESCIFRLGDAICWRGLPRDGEGPGVRDSPAAPSSARVLATGSVSDSGPVAPAQSEATCWRAWLGPGLPIQLARLLEDFSRATKLPRDTPRVVTGAGSVDLPPPTSLPFQRRKQRLATVATSLTDPPRPISIFPVREMWQGFCCPPTAPAVLIPTVTVVGA
mmetsp:Transcript_6275/g.18335  ORF Transcript_6275/g.18335 Transcript_6275/m.18335 type:complete len:353 (+) Transcript_6275:231-1289(+)